MTIISKLHNRKLMASSFVALYIASGLSIPVQAQVIINDDRTDAVETNGEDVTIENEGTITIDTTGPALVLNSNNNIINSGSITIEDVNNAIGVSLEGGENRNYTQSGSINVNETFEVAVFGTKFHDNGDRKKVPIALYDDVLGWQKPIDISKLMRQFQLDGKAHEDLLVAMREEEREKKFA